MSRFFVSMIALPLMLIGLATTPVTADMDQKDRAEMQQVIEQYIKTCLLYTSPSPRCLLYTSPSPRDGLLSRMPSSA